MKLIKAVRKVKKSDASALQPENEKILNNSISNLGILLSLGKKNGEKGISTDIIQDIISGLRKLQSNISNAR